MVSTSTRKNAGREPGGKTEENASRTKPNRNNKKNNNKGELYRYNLLHCIYTRYKYRKTSKQMRCLSLRDTAIPIAVLRLKTTFYCYEHDVLQVCKYSIITSLGYASAHNDQRFNTNLLTGNERFEKIEVNRN